MTEKFKHHLSRAKKEKPVEEEVGKYNVKKGFVEVHHKLFLPQNEIKHTDENAANVFATGWSVPENTRALERYGQKRADLSGKPTYLIDTPFHKVNGNTIAFEAEAMHDFLNKKGINKVSLSGHSRGGTKIMYLAAQLQERGDIAVENITLINSVGLYDQSLLDRTKGFMTDIIRTNISLSMHLHEQHGKRNFNNATNIFTDSLINQAQDALREGPRFVPKVLDELKPTGEINPHTHELKSPIVIITGAKDSLSDPEMIIPNKNRKRKEKPWLPFELRESYLKETLFSSSPSVKMLVAEKDPYHVGIVLRPHSYAQVQESMHRRILEESTVRKTNKSKERTVFSVTA